MKVHLQHHSGLLCREGAYNFAETTADKQRVTCKQCLQRIRGIVFRMQNLRLRGLR